MDKINKDTIVQYFLVFVISAFITLIGNCINTITDQNPDTFTSVLAGIPGVSILVAIAFAGSIMGMLIPKIPTIIWITLIGILLAMPYNVITGPVVAEQVNKIGLLSTSAPILGYAGVSIGMDWIKFKKIGLRGIFIALLVMIGTYVGSSLIAQIILSYQGII